MAPSKIPIFFIGATGYLGGSILIRLLAHPRVNDFEITAIVRSQEKAAILQSKFRVKSVVGSTAELENLENLCANAHIVFSCAESDNVEAMQAILRGLKKRKENTGETPILIHTSGTGELTDDAKGLHTTDTIFDDMNADQIESLPPTAFHRNVDLPIVEADKEGYLRSYIVLPGTIYGIASNPLVSEGIQNPISSQIPDLIRAGLGRGQGGVVGKGVSQWPDVSIEDVSELYIVLLNAILEPPDSAGHGREGYYFGENGEHTWYEICKEIAKTLHELGRGKSDEPTTFSTEELVKYFGSEWFGNYHGTNSRCRSNRARALGWKPIKTKADMLASIKPQVEYIIAKSG
ncbi:hypothetical protein C8Q75DRAFT_762665 [Abortiporus biennis]|nr:hypothetical protein C8Q75DRAFT_762665 [Abortiporus biennis]